MNRGVASSVKGKTAEPLAAVVRRINAVHGTSYVLAGRFSAGEQGAYRLADTQDRHWVLKWRRGETDPARVSSVAAVLERLRTAGHRVPLPAVWGVLADEPAGGYMVQEALPGAPPTHIDDALADQVVALVDCQAGVAAAVNWTGAAQPLTGGSEGAWPALPVDDVLRGGDGYCLLEPMRRHSPRAAALLAALQEYVSAHEHSMRAAVARADVVHFDLNPANVLAEEGCVTGVVDWDGACAGDRAFDVCTFLFYCYDARFGASEPLRARLWDRACALCGPAATGVYLAHMVHRQVDWMVRHHPPAVETWLAAARLVLADAATRTGWPAARLLAWWEC